MQSMASGDDALERDFHDLMAAAHPVSAMAEADALRAVRAYPQILLAGPMFGIAEQARRGWRVSCLGENTPQGARDALAEDLRRLATAAVDPSTREDFRTVAALLACERRDDLTVAGRRFRILRVEQVVRMNTGVPEPPRPTDPDPRPGGRGVMPRTPEFLPAAGEDLHGTAAAELTGRYEDTVPDAGTVPVGVRGDACRALTDYPRLRIMAPTFAATERIDGGWRSATMPCDTPQQARDTLAAYFSHVVPAVEHPGEAERAHYAAAAERLHRDRVDDLTVAGRRFRVVRIGRIVRLGTDGPEPPRRSDFDPEPPAGA
ncbi:MAG: hypothetical protein JWO67_370 [Streptosporangiaceae bacterium]|jgi:hypothetical protein|nr:hypothetical protein [Streptosporangiaceae bacterium]